VDAILAQPPLPDCLETDRLCRWMWELTGRTWLATRASRAYCARCRGAFCAGWGKATGGQVHYVSATLLPVAGLRSFEGAYPEGYLVLALGY
jgi:hypothetical protein